MARISKHASSVVSSPMTRRGFLGAASIAGALGAAGLIGCGANGQANSSGASSSASAENDATASADSATTASDLAISKSAWRYNADDDVYYQIGVQYCTSPAAPTYESMGIYVPSAYFDATDNGDGTFTCTPSATGKVGSYTAKTAPIVMPINTAGYSAQAAPDSYGGQGISGYLAAGFVYVYAGCRGRKMEDDACGASPWGVADLKAAVRTLRLNADAIAGDTDRIFSFGHSGGGAQSAVLGASGDSALYDDYLAEIGSPTTDASGAAISDAIFGAMCWCPITSLDVADAAYEWNMGQFADSGTRADGTFTRQLSQDLAGAFAERINEMGLVDESGKVLALEEGGEGVFTSGTYYDYMKGQVEESLNNFLVDTEFPYTPSGKFNADMGAGGGRSGGPSGGRPDGSRGSAPTGEPPAGGPGASGESTDASGQSDASGPSASASSSESTTYETAADYIAALNADEEWIEYDDSAGTASITGLAGFARACKSASKDVSAFDTFDRSKAENEVFGDEYTQGLHFDAIVADLLQANADAYAKLDGWESSYPTDYAEDRAFVDALGHDTDFRQNAYNPMYFVCASYEGAGTSTPAAHWRIRTGIEQGDTASTTEINLALALAANKSVSDVDFATVWGQGHTMAERTGDSTTNFIEWVNT